MPSPGTTQQPSSSAAPLGEQGQQGHRGGNAGHTMTEPSSGTTTTKKKRKKAELPSMLKDVSAKNIDQFILVDELDQGKNAAPGPFSVAKSFKYKDSDDNEMLFELKGLNLDQLRLLARNMGVKGSSNLTLFRCRHAIGIVCRNTKVSEDVENRRQNTAERKRNAVIRLVNVTFSPSFFPRLRVINDRKERSDFELGNSFRQFWTDVTDAVNYLPPQEEQDSDGMTASPETTSPESSSPSLLQPSEEEHEQDDISAALDRAVASLDSDKNDTEDESEEERAIETLEYRSNENIAAELCELPDELDLRAFDQMAVNLAQERTRSLFKVRASVSSLMSESGTHESDPFKFVDVAIKKAKVVALKRFECYYFYLKCLEHGDDVFNASFAIDMPKALKGSSTEIPFDELYVQSQSGGVSEATSPDSNSALPLIAGLSVKLQSYFDTNKKYQELQEERDKTLLDMKRRHHERTDKQNDELLKIKKQKLEVEEDSSWASNVTQFMGIFADPNISESDKDDLRQEFNEMKRNRRERKERLMREHRQENSEGA